jgi:hypothetical protein
VRSSNKKDSYLSVPPNILFARPSRSTPKPVLYHYIVSAPPPVPSSYFDGHVQSSSDESMLVVSDDYLEILELDSEFVEEAEANRLQNIDEDEVCLDDEKLNDIQEKMHEMYDDPRLDPSMDSFEYLSGLPSNKAICSSPTGNIQIMPKNISCLRPGYWIDDEIINFFIDSASFSCSAPHDTKILETYFFNSLMSVDTTTGSIGKYNFGNVRRNFVRSLTRVWLLSTICIPINIGNAHWITGVLFIETSKLVIVDSLEGSLDEQQFLLIKNFLLKWYQDVLLSTRKYVVSPNNRLYIEDPVERETVGRLLLVRSDKINEWDSSLRTIWKQNNHFECGLYCLIACLVFAFKEPVEPLVHLVNDSTMSRVREIILNFFRFKHASKSEEIFDPVVLFQLIKAPT